MKFTFKTEYLGGELTVETDSLADILDIFTAREPAKKTTESPEKDPNQMELPFKDEPKPEVVGELKVKKPRSKKTVDVVVQANVHTTDEAVKDVFIASPVAKETNIAGVEIKDEAKPVDTFSWVKEEPKVYTAADLQKAIIDHVTQTPEKREQRTADVKELVLKYSKSTAVADFPVKKIGDFLKDLGALN